MTPTTETARVPRRIFGPIASGYDGPAQALGLFQYRRWHRFLVSRLDPLFAEGGADNRVRILDMATGTGAIALDLMRAGGASVIGADITRPMLAQAQARADHSALDLPLVECTAEAPPFADESFDAVTFAYLLRYVSEVPATLHGLARLVRSGGIMASLDFAVPRGAWYPLWRIYTDAVLPLSGRVYSREWSSVGQFLGPNIRSFHHRWPEPRLLQAWREAGFPDVRSQHLSLGGGVVIWGTKS